MGEGVGLFVGAVVGDSVGPTLGAVGAGDGYWLGNIVGCAGVGSAVPDLSNWTYLAVL